MRSWSFSKGHGTGNDFVVLLDRDSTLDPGPAVVRYLCDRRTGVGGDGLLRAVAARHVPEWQGEGSLWFMDYRNADGSVAQMCGNGLRLFARYLLDAGLAGGPDVEIATRAGLQRATALPDGRIRVSMGPVRVGPPEQTVAVRTADGGSFQALAADVGNPHAVSFLDTSGAPGVLEALDLRTAPWFPPMAFPEGVNLEFVHPRSAHHIAMRVHERGVGETRSCGTGTVAAAAAARVHTADSAPLPVTYRVDVPGGSVEVELTRDQAYLTGPAVLVASGQVFVPEEG